MRAYFHESTRNSALAGVSISSDVVVLATRWCENGSQDDTLEIAPARNPKIAEVRVVVLEEADYGKAMRAGFLASRGEAVVNFDADYYDLDFLDPSSAGGWRRRRCR